MPTDTLLLLVLLAACVLAVTYILLLRNRAGKLSRTVLSLEADNQALAEQKNSQFELLKKSILETSRISVYKDEPFFQSQCLLLAKSICEIFHVEYCCIGMIEDGKARDFASEVIYEATEEGRKVLDDTREVPVENTLVGRALQASDEIDWHWSYAEQGREFSDEDARKLFGLEKNVLGRYREHVLRSKGFFNILSVGLYRDNDRTHPIGYITLANRWENGKPNENLSFTEEERETIRLIAENISILLENQKFQKAGNQDDRIINEWYSIDNVDDLLNKILLYLNNQFNSVIASYWTLAENGFDDDEKIVALRAFKIADDAPSWTEDYIDSNRESNLQDSLSGRIISNADGSPQDEIRFVNRETDDIRIVWEKIETPHVIGIPIVKSISPEKDFKPEDRLWGVICLQPKKAVENPEDNAKRLRDFAKHVQILLEKAIFKRRFQQLEDLNLRMKELQLRMPEREFYTRVTEIVAESSDTEACSIFMVSQQQDYLFLKATSSEEATNEITKKPIDKEKCLLEQTPIYYLNPQADSITANVFKRKKSALVYDLDKCKYTRKVFVEKANSAHKSIIAMPLFNALGEPVGVIRCINKKKAGNLLHTFVKGDLELLNIITGIISGYLIYKEYDEQRNKALAHFGHENRSPVSGLQYSLELLDFYLNEKQNTAQANKHLRHCMQELAVIKHNTNNTESILLGKDEDVVKYDFRKCNLNEMLKKIAELFAGRNKIISNTGKAPELYVDEKRMYQVFYNLLYNAVRYSNKSSTIEVYYEKDTHYPYEHKFKFVNEGIGVEIGEEDKIFEIPNYRSHKAKVVEPAGSGYGLKVCKKIIEKHDGRIKVTHHNHPTEFTVFLPEYLEKKKVNP